MIDATAPVQNESQSSTAQLRAGRRYDQQMPLHVIFVFLAVALFVGVVVPLAGEFSIYPIVGLAVVPLLGLVVYHIVKTFGLATLALASSLLWFSIIELIAGAQLEWVKFNREIVVRVQGIGAGAPILLLAALLLLRPPVLRKVRELDLLEFVLATSVILGGFTMVIGILRGNAIGYVLGDTYKFVLTPIVYLVCVTMVVKREQRLFLWKFIALSGLLISALGMVIQFYKFAIGWPYRLGRDIDLFALAVSVLLYVSSVNKRVRFVALLATVVLVVGAVVSLERRDWLYVILVWVFAMILKKGWPRLRLIRLALAGCGLLLVALLVFNLILPDVVSETAMRLEKRYNRTVGREDGGVTVSFTRRIDEVGYIVQEFQEASLIYLLTGLGQGAEFHDVVSESGSRPGLSHNVHNTYISVFFRAGIVGFFLVVGFVVLSLKLSYSCVRYAQKQGSFLELLLLQAAFVYLLVSFIVNWNVSPSMGEIQLAVVVGLLASTMRWQLRPDSL